ncbi:family 20 glycosylhydrolase [Spirosoma linguale]|uniref:beta-N-acetylhexosaminidase n=1 Tax=Spirosoma linguale (strain ATCC 33905 / DSM 74 / LMG 10896 / Claus 1) TaxID=504472 RepID=D2QHT4_SPILD|nr:Beta-N-acetylhexosaminidase [Spirosoma linguale DSM 74]
MQIKPIIFIVGLSLLMAGIGQSQTPDPYPIIPYPTSLVPGQGQFVITQNTALVVQDGRFQSEAGQLQQLLKPVLGKPLPARGGNAQIVLNYDPSITSPEGYQLTIAPQRITLAAREPVGMFRAIQTIRQLLPVSLEQKKTTGPLTLPAVQIRDQPAYAWRGMHLDVSRHFFSMDYLHKFVDLLALYKFNKFHLHLTDDQGWRLEIKAYPKLTSEGAWRTFNNQDSVVLKRATTNPDFDLPKQYLRQKDGKTQYGGFYTQNQMRELIAYAAARHIEIIPEIDMPGHLTAAIKAYPFLSCTGQEGWGKTFSVPICPCNEPTYTFTETVLSEVAALFPSQYIHIGADEVEKSTWAQSTACQALMKREGIKSVEELQSYFVHRTEKFLLSKGKKLMVWDDALEGGLAPSATVMYWRSWVTDAPVKAVRNGNPVVMTPVNTLYFDVLPDKNSLANVYQFNPVPTGLTPAEATSILGAQANTWTEYIPSENRVDYMVMPRMTALAERLWTNQNQYDTYRQRLTRHYPRLDALGVHYRVPDLSGFAEENVFTDQTALRIRKPTDNLVVRYTIDGSLPKAASALLPESLPISQPTTVKLAAFTNSGLQGDVYTLRYQQQSLAEPVGVSSVGAGLMSTYVKGQFKNVAAMLKAPASDSVVVNQVKVPEMAGAGSFGVRFRGYISVPATGIYSFFLVADDGGVLHIANRTVIDNDGNHGPIEKSGQVALKRGTHPFALDFIEAGGGYTLKLLYSRDGSDPQPVPADWLGH